MFSWIRRLLAVAAALAGGLVVATSVAGRAWKRETERLLTRLNEPADEGEAPVPATWDPAALVGLPEPVARYFRWALTPGQPLVRAARIEHEGEFRGSLEAAWSPFTSVQHFTVSPPGFVWDARIATPPLVGVRVRDFYIGGDAGMLGRIGGVFTVVEQAGTPELASGALHRAFAERVWLPTALLPGRGVRWEALDGSSARATLTDHGIVVSMVAHFAPGGEIERVEMLRYRDAGGVGAPTPFEGRFRAYRRIEGMMVPTEGEVAWLLPEGRFDYWKARIVSVRYEFHG